MTVLAKSFAFEGLNFDDHHMAFDGFVDVTFGTGLEGPGNCLSVVGGQSTALTASSGSGLSALSGQSCANLIGGASCLETT